MLKTFGNIFKIPDLKKKVFFTLFIIIVHRFGCHVPIPFVDADAMSNFWTQRFGAQGLVNIIDMFSGRAFRNMTVFALGVMPYITASIIIQLLMVVWPYLEKIAKEGEIGHKKINQYTRYGTVAIAAFQSMGIALFMLRMNLTTLVEHKLIFIFITMIAMTAGKHAQAVAYGDEIDLAARLKKTGFASIVTKKAVLWHNHKWEKQNKEGFYFEYYLIQRNKYLYFRKHKLYFNMFISYLTDILKFPVRLLWFMRVCDLKLGYYYLKGTYAGLFGCSGRPNLSFMK